MKLLLFNNLTEYCRRRISRQKQLNPILSPEELLESHGGVLTSIFLSSGIADHHFIALYRYPIERTAGILQLMPGPEAGSHHHPGGMIAHILEACSIALKYRKNVNLPIGAPPEERAKKRDLYTYAVFAAALLRHVGGVLYSQRPTLYDWRGKYLAEWNPLLEDLGWHQKARFMKTGSDKMVLSHHRPMESLMYMGRILPKAGLLWLREDRDVYGKFLDAMSDAPRGPIYELVRKAYRACEDEYIPEIPRTPHQGGPSPKTNVVEDPRKPEDAGEVPARPVKEVQAPKGKSRNSAARKASRKSTNGTAGKPAEAKVAPATAGNGRDEALMSQGEIFRTWLEDQINDSSLKMNEMEAPVHFVEQGAFLVLPNICQIFAEGNATKADVIQREFENLGIHQKNPDNGDQNCWKARLSGFGKTSFLTGWIVPTGSLHLRHQPPRNEKLVIMGQ